MRLRIGNKLAAAAAGLLLMSAATGGAPAAQQRPLPNPVLVFAGPEFFQSGGKQWTRYRLMVDNSDQYPNELFAPAPGLPPCGANTKAARTWVDIFDQSGKRLNGFCALANRDGLGKIWFALQSDEVPPSWVYIELNDRQTSTKYKSNLSETVE